MGWPPFRAGWRRSCSTIFLLNLWLGERLGRAVGYLTLINRAPDAWGRFYRWLDGRQEFAPQIGRLPMVERAVEPTPGALSADRGGIGFPAYPYLLETILGRPAGDFP
jgi:hypothetical protein